MGLLQRFRKKTDAESPAAEIVAPKAVIPQSAEAELLLQTAGWDDTYAWITEQKTVLDGLLSQANDRSQALIGGADDIHELTQGGYIAIDQAAETAAAAYEPLNTASTAYQSLTTAMNNFAYMYEQATDGMMKNASELVLRYYEKDLLQAQATFDSMRAKLDDQVNEDLAPKMAAVEMVADSVQAARANRQQLLATATAMEAQETILSSLEEKIERLRSEPAQSLPLPQWCQGLDAVIDQGLPSGRDAGDLPQELVDQIDLLAVQYRQALVGPLLRVDDAMLRINHYVGEAVDALNAAITTLADVGIHSEVTHVTKPELPSTGSASEEGIKRALSIVYNYTHDMSFQFSNSFSYRDSQMGDRAHSLIVTVSAIDRHDMPALGSIIAILEEFEALANHNLVRLIWAEKADDFIAGARQAQLGYRCQPPRIMRG